MRSFSSRSISAVAPLSPRARFDAHLTRRHALRLIGGMSAATAGLLSLNSARAQEASGTPPPVVTPEIGPQADGSTRWRVQVAEMNMEEAYEFHAFFPGEMTVNEGDSVWFDFGMGGFHTVSFLSGGEEPPIWVEAPGGATPEAESEPKLIINPSVQWEQGTATYDGTGYLNSGIDVFRDPSTPYVVTFTTAGEYEYVCIIHSHVMKAKLIVQAAGSEPAHTQEEYDAISQEEKTALTAMVESELAKYAEATKTENADGTTNWGVVVGAGGETELRIQRFLPGELEIKVGDSVTWTNQAYGEPHTVSFIGAGETPPEDITVEIGADGMPMFVQSPLTLFKAGGDTWSGTGWVNSGFLGFHKLEGSPIEYTLTFDTPGEYIPFCVLHGDSEGNGMASKLTVLPA